MTVHTAQAPNPDSFVKLLQQFANSIGLPDEASELGMTFDVSGYGVSLVPDITDADSLVLDIDFGLSPGDNPALLRLLLQLNDEAGRAHHWVLALDADAQLLIRARRSWTHSRPEDLIDWLAEGIERAEAIREIVEDFPAQVRPDPLPAPRDAQMIRG